MRHLTSLLDLSSDDTREILACAAELKALCQAGQRPPRLAGRILTQIFEKPSLRTRASFAAAMSQLGGGSQFFDTAAAGL